MLLHFCGLLQHYGLKREGNLIRTSRVPTRSAIAGLLACAGGIPRKDPRIEEIRNSIQYKIDCFETPVFGKPLKRRDKKNIPTLWDFQSMCDCPNCPPGYPGVYKEYIEDTYFQILLTDTDENIENYKKWLCDPCWDTYLGSKCCIPSIPIYLGDCETDAYRELYHHLIPNDW